MKQYEAVINFMSYCEQTLRAEPPWLKKLGTRRERLEKKSSFGCILRQSPLSFTINKVNRLVVMNSISWVVAYRPHNEAKVIYKSHYNKIETTSILMLGGLQQLWKLSKSVQVQEKLFKKLTKNRTKISVQKSRAMVRIEMRLHLRFSFIVGLNGGAGGGALKFNLAKS